MHLLRIVEHALPEVVALVLAAAAGHPTAWIHGLIIGGRGGRCRRHSRVHGLVMRGERAPLVFHGRDAALHALQLAVEQVGAEATRHRVVGEETQVVVVKLERHRELALQLVHHVQELEECRGKRAGLRGRVQVTPGNRQILLIKSINLDFHTHRYIQYKSA